MTAVDECYSSFASVKFVSEFQCEMGDNSNVKAFLNTWLSKQKLSPTYDVRQQMKSKSGRARFMCEVNISHWRY